MMQYLALVDDGICLKLATSPNQKIVNWSISSVEFAPHLFTQDTVSSFELEGRDREYHVIYHPGSIVQQWNGVKSYVDALLKITMIAFAVRDLTSKRSPFDRNEPIAGAAFLATQGKNGLNVFKDHEDAQRHFRDASIYHTEGYYYRGGLLVRGVVKRSDIRTA